VNEPGGGQSDDDALRLLEERLSAQVITEGAST
jgi:hypothetical protein